MVQSDKFKFVKKLFYAAMLYGFYSIWKYPFNEVIIYDYLFEPFRVKLYASLGFTIIGFLIYPYLSIQYEMSLVREIRYMNNKLNKKKNRYSNIAAAKDDKSWGDVIEEAKNKPRDSM